MLALSAWGCAGVPTVQRVAVPSPGSEEARRVEAERERPMPPQRDVDRELPPPPFQDVPLVSQRVPEQDRFEQAYKAVGRPRLTILVNKSPDGQAISTLSDGQTDVEQRKEERNSDRHSGREQSNRVTFKSSAFDEVMAKGLDYEAMENILTDFMACQGAVEIISPAMARQKLTDEQIKALQSGRIPAGELIGRLDTDVLIQVSARPTRQTENGLEVRMVGEAINVKGGQQIARGVVDITPPLDKPTINRYTRFLARKLMMDLTMSWSAPEAPRESGREPARDRGAEAPKP